MESEAKRLAGLRSEYIMENLWLLNEICYVYFTGIGVPERRKLCFYIYGGQSANSMLFPGNFSI